MAKTEKKAAKEMTGFKMDIDRLNKARYVAWYERTSLTALITEDLNKRVDGWEKKNGEITEAMIKKMEESK